MSYTRRTKGRTRAPRGAGHLRRRLRQPGHRPAHAGGQPPAARHRGGAAQRERHPGHGPVPAQGEEDYDIINAGKQPVTLLPGGVYFHHADSFAMMRGGHLDICVLGAFQVSATGDLANWSTGEPGSIPAVGGAMDLAIGAKQTWVMMDLLTKKGESKGGAAVHLSAHRSAASSASTATSRPFECTPEGLRLIDAVQGLSVDELQRPRRTADRTITHRPIHSPEPQ